MKSSVLSAVFVTFLALLFAGCGPGDGPGTITVGTLNAPVLTSPTGGTVTREPIIFTWQPVDNATSYTVQITLLNGTSFTPNPAVDLTNIVGTNVTVSGFANNTNYRWRVRANASGFNSGTADFITFNTDNDLSSKPSIPTSIQ